jgi:hypothetical protein
MKKLKYEFCYGWNHSYCFNKLQGHAIAMAVVRQLLTLEAQVQFQLTDLSFVVDKVTLKQVLPPPQNFFSVPLLIIPPFLHMHQSLPPEVCNSPNQAAHYHILGF